ncbi:hypothetical protein L596_004417 [Steinernema carpocapsae]|uniref:Uncharacterized protein n=1 Tax=Steinernema carpocapsae TaxID=34508 RepID=A0A4U8UXD2_STECR|nr:hypothetical protein L596_004417 [Steinernema carpocapsae]
MMRYPKWRRQPDDEFAGGNQLPTLGGRAIFKCPSRRYETDVDCHPMTSTSNLCRRLLFFAASKWPRDI